MCDIIFDTAVHPVEAKTMPRRFWTPPLKSLWRCPVYSVFIFVEFIMYHSIGRSPPLFSSHNPAEGGGKGRPQPRGHVPAEVPRGQGSSGGAAEHRGLQHRPARAGPLQQVEAVSVRVALLCFLLPRLCRIGR